MQFWKLVVLFKGKSEDAVQKEKISMKLSLDGILSHIGNTPLVHLTNVINAPLNLYAKLEGMNPGGSLKDRPALEIIRHGIETGQILQDTVVVEATSGNMGIALAQICRRLGLRFICVIDGKITNQNLRILKAYGAELEIVTIPEPVTGELLQARIDRAREIAGSLSNSFWVNQYCNLYNALAHQRTMEEICAGLKGGVDYVFCAASTCGTLRGCVEYLRKNKMRKVKVCAVDAVGSVIFGGAKGKRMIPGHGAGVKPGLHESGLADRCVSVTDLECIIGCRRLLSKEALLVGGTSGATFMAVQQIKDEIPAGSNCVLIFPDRGERYLDTVFCDEWVEEHFGSALRTFDLQNMLLENEYRVEAI